MKPNKVRIPVYMTPEQKEQIEKAALAAHRTLSGWLLHLALKNAGGQND